MDLQIDLQKVVLPRTTSKSKCYNSIDSRKIISHI